MSIVLHWYHKLYQNRRPTRLTKSDDDREGLGHVCPGGIAGHDSPGSCDRRQHETERPAHPRASLGIASRDLARPSGAARACARSCRGSWPTPTARPARGRCGTPAGRRRRSRRPARGRWRGCWMRTSGRGRDPHERLAGMAAGPGAPGRGECRGAPGHVAGQVAGAPGPPAAPSAPGTGARPSAGWAEDDRREALRHQLRELERQIREEQLSDWSASPSRRLTGTGVAIRQEARRRLGLPEEVGDDEA